MNSKVPETCAPAGELFHATLTAGMKVVSGPILELRHTQPEALSLRSRFAFSSEEIGIEQPAFGGNTLRPKTK